GSANAKRPSREGRPLCSVCSRGSVLVLHPLAVTPQLEPAHSGQTRGEQRHRSRLRSGGRRGVADRRCVPTGAAGRGRDTTRAAGPARATGPTGPARATSSTGVAARGAGGGRGSEEIRARPAAADRGDEDAEPDRSAASDEVRRQVLLGRVRVFRLVRPRPGGGGAGGRAVDRPSGSRAR